MVKADRSSEDFFGPLGMRDQDGITQIIRETCELAGMPEAFADISWEFSGRLTTTLGYAWYKRFKVELCFELWGRASYEQRKDVIIHETVHLLCYRKYRTNCGHGYHWRAMMVQCGGDPSRCHDVNTKGVSRKQKQYHVPCGCMTHCVSANKLTRMRNGRWRYCNRCGIRLEHESAELLDAWMYD